MAWANIVFKDDSSSLSSDVDLEDDSSSVDGDENVGESMEVLDDVNRNEDEDDPELYYDSEDSENEVCEHLEF